MTRDVRPTGEPPAATPAERRIARSRQDDQRHGRFSTESLQSERTVEGYLRAAVMPRWMERLKEIHAGMDRHRRELAGAYAYHRERHGDDTAAFASAWRDRVRRWSFEDVNELVRQHNDWYPVERQLPMDPRTGDYVLIAGRSYRRDELDAAWALEQFPAE
jgi:hypothetical protein